MQIKNVLILIFFIASTNLFSITTIQEAERDLKSPDPEKRADAHLFLGDIYRYGFQSKDIDFKKALDHYSKALTSKDIQTKSIALVNLGEITEHPANRFHHKSHVARTYFSKALQNPYIFDSLKARAQYGLELVNKRHRKSLPSIEYINNIKKRSLNIAEFYYELGKLYQLGNPQLGIPKQYEVAESYLLEALNHNPEASIKLLTYLLLADIYREGGFGLLQQLNSAGLAYRMVLFLGAGGTLKEQAETGLALIESLKAPVGRQIRTIKKVPVRARRVKRRRKRPIKHKAPLKPAIPPIKPSIIAAIRKSGVQVMPETFELKIPGPSKPAFVVPQPIEPIAGPSVIVQPVQKVSMKKGFLKEGRYIMKKGQPEMLDLKQEEALTLDTFQELIEEHIKKKKTPYTIARVLSGDEEVQYVHYFDKNELEGWIMQKGGERIDPNNNEPITKIELYTIAGIQEPNFIYLEDM